MSNALHPERAYSVSDKIVQATGLMYNNTRACVLTPDGNTDYFELLAGVLQVAHASAISVYHYSILHNETSH